MNSGLEWDEDYGSISDVTKMLYIDADMTSPQIHKKAIHKPNEYWYYSSGTSNLLSGILRKQFANYQEYLDYPYREFIDKIGMNSMLIETDMAGNYVGSSYAWATVRDWGKFGLLYLHKGNWNGVQIFDPNWVNYVTTPSPTSNGDYGGHFWLNAGGFYPDAPRDMFSANGFQGQRVFIIPSKDLVIVRFGLIGDRGVDFNTFIKEMVSAVE
jgi:CubicO group peptidase (beta-lactamase class C family)